MQENVEEDREKNMEKSKQKFTNKKKKCRVKNYFSTSRKAKTLKRCLKIMIMEVFLLKGK